MAIQQQCPKCKLWCSGEARKCLEGHKLPAKEYLLWRVYRADLDGKVMRSFRGTWGECSRMDVEIVQAKSKGVMWRVEHSPATVAEVTQEYLADPKNQARKDWRTHGPSVKRAAVGLGLDRKVMTLRPQDIHAYQRRRQDEGVGNSAINVETIAFNRMLEYFASTGERIPSNPIKGYRTLSAPDPRNRTAAPPETVSLGLSLDDPPATATPAFVLHWVPMRAEECFQLSWTQTDSAPWLNTLPDPMRPWWWAVVVPPGVSKSGRERIIPIWYPEVRDALAAMPSRMARGKVFAGLRSGDYRVAWQERLKALGIENLRLHDLKHTAVTYLLWYGVSAMQVEHASDHSGPYVAAIYKNMTVKWMMRSLDRYFNPRTGLIEKLEPAQGVMGAMG